MTQIELRELLGNEVFENIQVKIGSNLDLLLGRDSKGNLFSKNLDEIKYSLQTFMEEVSVLKGKIERLGKSITILIESSGVYLIVLGIVGKERSDLVRSKCILVLSRSSSSERSTKYNFYYGIDYVLENECSIFPMDVKIQKITHKKKGEFGVPLEVAVKVLYSNGESDLEEIPFQ